MSRSFAVREIESLVIGGALRLADDRSLLVRRMQSQMVIV
jgi:hypothetical protein